MRIGILGAGNIAGVLAQTFAKMDGVECYAIASRSKEAEKKTADMATKIMIEQLKKV